MKIGALSESFLLPIHEVIETSVKLGLDGLQLFAAKGELTPDNLDKHAKKKLVAHMRDAGLSCSAVCGDLGGHGFQMAEENPLKIERSKAIANLAIELETQVITTHIGVIPKDVHCDLYHVMQEACYELGEYAHKKGAIFAIETGPEPILRLKGFLDSLHTKGMGVNYDPANLLMVLNEDPVPGVSILGDYIVHTHAKDGVHLAASDPVSVYDAFAKGGIAGFDFGVYFNETPLGEGSVAWDAYVHALKATGYDGFLTIEREVGINPIQDIQAAVTMLRGLLGKI